VRSCPESAWREPNPASANFESLGQISRFCRSDLLRQACRPFAEVLISELSSIEDDFLPTPGFSETRRTGFSEIELKSFSDFSDTSFADRFAGPIEHALRLDCIGLVFFCHPIGPPQSLMDILCGQLPMYWAKISATIDVDANKTECDKSSKS
jgi:hypothetical protein